MAEPPDGLGGQSRWRPGAGPVPSHRGRADDGAGGGRLDQRPAGNGAATPRAGPGGPGSLRRPGGAGPAARLPLWSGGHRPGDAQARWFCLACRDQAFRQPVGDPRDRGQYPVRPGDPAARAGARGAGLAFQAGRPPGARAGRRATPSPASGDERRSKPYGAELRWINR